MEGQYERVSQQPRELLYSVPAALCDEIACAATAELAERLSIPDLAVLASSYPRGLEQVHFFCGFAGFFRHGH